MRKLINTFFQAKQPRWTKPRVHLQKVRKEVKKVYINNKRINKVKRRFVRYDLVLF
jgi:hypothetical protein